MVYALVLPSVRMYGGGGYVFEKIHIVFPLTERDKMVEGTSAWPFCLQKRMFLETK